MDLHGEHAVTDRNSVPDRNSDTDSKCYGYCSTPAVVQAVSTADNVLSGNVASGAAQTLTVNTTGGASGDAVLISYTMTKNGCNPTSGAFGWLTPPAACTRLSSASGYSGATLPVYTSNINGFDTRF